MGLRFLETNSEGSMSERGALDPPKHTMRGTTAAREMGGHSNGHVPVAKTKQATVTTWSPTWSNQRQQRKSYLSANSLTKRQKKSSATLGLATYDDGNDDSSFQPLLQNAECRLPHWNETRQRHKDQIPSQQRRSWGVNRLRCSPAVPDFIML